MRKIGAKYFRSFSGRMEQIFLHFSNLSICKNYNSFITNIFSIDLVMKIIVDPIFILNFENPCIKSWLESWVDSFLPYRNVTRNAQGEGKYWVCGAPFKENFWAKRNGVKNTVLENFEIFGKKIKIRMALKAVFWKL